MRVKELVSILRDWLNSNANSEMQIGVEAGEHQYSRPRSEDNEFGLENINFLFIWEGGTPWMKFKKLRSGPKQRSEWRFRFRVIQI